MKNHKRILEELIKLNEILDIKVFIQKKELQVRNELKQLGYKKMKKQKAEEMK